MTSPRQTTINRFLVLALMCSGVALKTANAAELMLAPGVTSQGETAASIGLAFEWEQRWLESERGHLGGYWSVAYTWWEAGKIGDDEQSLSVSPVFVYSFNADGWQPFVEAGIGAAYFSDDRVGGRNLGSRAHFEDRFAVGARLSDRDTVRLRVIHYSNAGLEGPNQGVNAWSLVYSRRF